MLTQFAACFAVLTGASAEGALEMLQGEDVKILVCAAFATQSVFRGAVFPSFSLRQHHPIAALHLPPWLHL
jgi:hypothetical protein